MTGVKRGDSPERERLFLAFNGAILVCCSLEKGMKLECKEKNRCVIFYNTEALNLFFFYKKIRFNQKRFLIFVRQKKTFIDLLKTKASRPVSGIERDNIGSPQSNRLSLRQ